MGIENWEFWSLSVLGWVRAWISDLCKPLQLRMIRDFFKSIREGISFTISHSLLGRLLLGQQHATCCNKQGILKFLKKILVHKSQPKFVLPSCLLCFVLHFKPCIFWCFRGGMRFQVCEHQVCVHQPDLQRYRRLWRPQWRDVLQQ